MSTSAKRVLRSQAEPGTERDLKRSRLIDDESTESGTDTANSGDVNASKPCTVTQSRPSTPTEWNKSEDGSATDKRPSETSTTSTIGSASHSAVAEDSSTPASSAGLVDAVTASFVGLHYVPQDVLRRAAAFALKNDPATNRFAIGQLPLDLTWGSTPPTERFLVDARGNPVTVWFLGVMHSKWLFNMNGEPHPRVNIGFGLPFKGNYDALRRLYCKARPQREDTPDIVYASRMMTRQQKGDDVATTVPFTAIYDARHRFRPKRDMHTIAASSIGKGDIILIETHVTRWKTSKDKKNRRGWTLWDMGFELHAIAHLFDAPSGFDQEVGDTVQDFDDDM